MFVLGYTKCSLNYWLTTYTINILGQRKLLVKVMNLAISMFLMQKVFLNVLKIIIKIMEKYIILKSCYAHSIKGYRPLWWARGVLIPSPYVNNSWTLIFKIRILLFGFSNVFLQQTLVETPTCFLPRRRTCFSFIYMLLPSCREVGGDNNRGTTFSN